MSELKSNTRLWVISDHQPPRHIHFPSLFAVSVPILPQLLLFSAQLCPIQYPRDCSTLGLLVPHHHLEFPQVHVYCISDAIQPSHPLLLLPSVFPSIMDFSCESAVRLRYPKYWALSFSISPSKEYSGLISFKMDWFDPKDSQDSSPALQFKGINSFVLCLLYGPAPTTVHDHWEDHCLDYRDLC